MTERKRDRDREIEIEIDRERKRLIEIISYRIGVVGDDARECVCNSEPRQKCVYKMNSL